MSELLRSQRVFASAIRERSLPLDALRTFIGDAALIERRLAIYKANVAAASTKALTAAYPVVQRLVGAEFFGGLSREYLRTFPSTSGDLFDFGDELAGFLQNFAHTQTLPYLPDLARLEWRVHRAYGAHDAEPFDVAALAHVPAEQQGEICFQWAAGTALVVSPYPIVQLWQIHQSGFDGNFEVDWSRGETACVTRDGFAVVVLDTTASDAAFIDASLVGASLGLSCEVAFSFDAAFDPGVLLSRAIASNLITGFTLPSNESTS